MALTVAIPARRWAWSPCGSMAGSGCTAEKAKDSVLDPIPMVLKKTFLDGKEYVRGAATGQAFGLAWVPTERTFRVEKLARVVWMARVVVVVSA